MAETKKRSGFTVSDCALSPGNDPNTAKLVVTGRRFGQPTKRFTLQRAGLDIISAKITYSNKNKLVEYETERINSLPTFGQTRIHTKTLLYPGDYELVLVLKGADRDIRSRLADAASLFG